MGDRRLIWAVLVQDYQLHRLKWCLQPHPPSGKLGVPIDQKWSFWIFNADPFLHHHRNLKHTFLKKWNLEGPGNCLTPGKWKKSRKPYGSAKERWRCVFFCVWWMVPKMPHPPETCNAWWSLKENWPEGWMCCPFLVLFNCTPSWAKRTCWRFSEMRFFCFPFSAHTKAIVCFYSDFSHYSYKNTIGTLIFEL